MRVSVLGGDVEVNETLVQASPGELRRQVEEYAVGRRRRFDLAVDVPDSFTGRVMEAMSAIPYAETRTYGELAAELDTAARAVGGGCGRNPVPVVVPCHRVVRADGGLGGFSAPGGIELKRRLLNHEAAVAAGDD